MPIQVKKVQLKLKDGQQYKDGDLLFNVDAQAWAQGTRNGQPVSSTDETYEHNAKYWSDLASQTVFTGNLGSEYDSTQTYNFGDYVVEDGKLYRCKVTINTPENFILAHWEEVKIGDQIDDIIKVNAQEITGATKIQIETTDEDIDLALSSQLNTLANVLADTTASVNQQITNINDALIALGPDTTLSVSGTAADAKATGDALTNTITSINQQITDINNTLEALEPDSTLSIPGATADAKVTGDVLADLKARLNFNKTAPQGYILTATNNGAGQEWAPVGLPTDEQTEDAINTFFNSHPEAWATVQEESLTKNQFSDQLKLEAIKDYVTPQMFGAVGDGTTDDYIAINNCVIYAKNNVKNIVFPKVAKSYYITQPIVIDAKMDVFMQSPISSSCDALIIGDPTKNINRCKYVIKLDGKVNSNEDWVPSTGVKFQNITDSNIQIVEVQRYINGVVFTGKNTKGCVYNYVQLGTIMNCEKCVTLKGESNGWCTENLFINGKLGHYSNLKNPENFSIGIYTQTQPNGYHIDNTVFIKPCVESCDKGFVFQNATRNTIISCRTESVKNPFYFDENSHYNIVTIGTGNKGIPSNDTATSIDNGNKNVILKNQEIYDLFYSPEKTITIPIFDSGVMSEYCFIHNKDSNITNDIDESCTGKFLFGINNSNGNKVKAVFTRQNEYLEIGLIGIGVAIDTSINKDFRFKVMRKRKNDSTEYDSMRYSLIMFDANGNKITPWNGKTNISLGPNLSFGKFVTGDIKDDRDLVIQVPEECKKIQIGISRGSDVQSSRIYRMIIYSTQPVVPYSNDYPQGLSIAPNCYGIDGEIVYSTLIDNIGWRYRNNTWEAF